MSSKQWKMKLMISKTKKSVIFAEVSSDFVDYWCKLLEKPFRDVIPECGCAFATIKNRITDLPSSMFSGNEKQFLTSELVPKTSNPATKRTNVFSPVALSTNINNIVYVQESDLENRNCSYCTSSRKQRYGKQTVLSYRCKNCGYSFCKDCLGQRNCNCGYQYILKNSDTLCFVKENLVFILSSMYFIHFCTNIILTILI